MTQQEETPKWLEELQQRSWEPEVLLSGIVLYGMFKVPPLLDKFLLYFQANIWGETNDIVNLIGILKLGIYWLIVGLILHLICRGIWVGMIGLSYTFPDGARHDKVKFTGRFRQRIEHLPPFGKIIILLEKLCSSLFSMAFMLFMSMVGAYSFMFVILILPVLLLFQLFADFSWTDHLLFKVYVYAVLIIAVIGLVDFLTLGYFRRFRWFSWWYWPVHRLISALTLARFYRPVYYTFVTNFNKWVIFICFTLFTVINIYSLRVMNNPGDHGRMSMLSFWHPALGTQAYHGYYADQNEDDYSIYAQIPSDVIDGNVLKLFIPAAVNKEDSIRAFVNYDSLVAINKKKNVNEVDLEAVSRFYHVQLDDSLITGSPWFYHYNPKTQQYGYLVYIDITTLPAGVHTLDVSGPPSMYKHKWAIIPFYREEQ